AAGISAGFSVALGPRRAANLAGGLADGRSGGSLDVAQAAVEPGDYGWRASATSGRIQQQQAEVSTILPWSTANLGGEHVGRAINGRAGLTGALVLAGGDLFAARRVDDSFAVVETDGLPGVQVLRENRVVGRTNTAGRLLVPDLRGWDANRIAIDPSTMPGDVELGALQQVIRPEDHAALSIRFTAKHGGSAVVHLVTAGGRAIPPGSTAILARTGQAVPVGHDGETFLTGLQGEETALVSTARGRCQAKFRFVPQPGNIPQIGPVLCEGAKE
ncbi:MAG: fimbrial biogenesis outer membrane usher protein, partial [Oxalobacteraceae bacterium]